jgi:hypothetical protein
VSTNGKSILLISALLAGMVVAIVLAIVVDGSRVGDLPASISPRGLLITLASGFFALAATTLWHALGRRRDAALAASTSAELVLGAVTLGRRSSQLQECFPHAPRSLPARLSIAATQKGLEIWGPPKVTLYFTISWNEVSGLAPTNVASFARSFGGVAVQLGKDRVLSIPLTGDSLTGGQSPSAAQVQETVARLLEIRAASLGRQ